MNDLGSIIRQLEQQKSAIERALSALREVSGISERRPSTADESAAAKTPRKRRMSPEGRKRIGDAARRRWAAKRAAEASSPAKTAKATKKSAKQARAASA